MKDEILKKGGKRPYTLRKQQEDNKFVAHGNGTEQKF
jgi:hypothetical protein